MKARSVVFTHIQHPAAVFGLPPRLVAVAVAPAVLVYGVSVVAGGLAVSMIALAVTLMAGFGLATRLARRDRHVDSVVLAGLLFWGMSPRRWLLAGASGPRSRRGSA
jgi:hypothetical protein